MKSTKKSLLASGASLLLSAALLAGSTFAWFTDSVTNTGNKIEAGTLQVQLWDGQEDISESTKPVFDYNLWEPGYSTGAELSVHNTGTLAVKYELELQKVQATQGIENVIDVIIDEKTVGTLADYMNGEDLDSGVLAAGDASDAKAITLKMQKSADNRYQGATATFDILLKATQAPVEYDGFGDNTYDDNAVYLPDEVQSAAEGLDTVVSGGTGTVGSNNTNAGTGTSNKWFEEYADQAAIDYVTGFDDGEFVVRVRPQEIAGTTLAYVIANVRGEDDSTEVKAKIELNGQNAGHPEITDSFTDLGNGWYEYRTSTYGMGDQIGYILSVGYANQHGQKGEAYIRAAAGWKWESYVKADNLCDDVKIVEASSDAETNGAALKDAIETVADGGTVMVPAGEYTVGAIDLGNKTVVLQGSEGTVLTRADEGFITVRGSTDADLTVRNFQFEGTANNDGSRGVCFSGQANTNATLTVEDCTFTNLNTGIYLGGVSDAVISNCTFTNCTAGIGGSEDISKALYVKNCEFANNTENIGWAGTGDLVISGCPTCDSFVDYTNDKNGEKVTVTDGTYPGTR